MDEDDSNDLYETNICRVSPPMDERENLEALLIYEPHHVTWSQRKVAKCLGISEPALCQAWKRAKHKNTRWPHREFLRTQGRILSILSTLVKERDCSIGQRDETALKMLLQRLQELSKPTYILIKAI